jgi:O-antigen ligase
MLIAENIYPTNFGDLSEPDQQSFSRVILSIPVTRPALSMAIKIFLPIVLVVICAALVFFIRPKEIGARIGLGITALLTLVALQLTASSVLPDVNYLMMLDKVFLLAYVFILIAIARAVATSWRGVEAKAQKSIGRHDRIWFGAVFVAYLAVTIGVVWNTVT